MTYRTIKSGITDELAPSGGVQDQIFIYQAAKDDTYPTRPLTIVTYHY